MIELVLTTTNCIKMTIVKIYKVEDCDEKQLIRVFDEGEHVIGRDNLLCTDKRISRRHATLNISTKNIVFKTVHGNPCFYAGADGDKVLIIPKDKEIVLKDNDKFGFLPDEFWYKIRISEEDEQELGVAFVERVKHSLYEDGLTQESKKPRLESPETVNSSQNNNIKEEEVIPLEDLENSHQIIINDTSTIEGSTVNATMTEDGIEETTKNDSGNGTTSCQDNPDKATTSGACAAPPSNQPQMKERRERCWYGSQCFRKNPQHKSNFSHPGDDDYASDANDDRPSCSYGAACYRRNMIHRRQYKHPNRPAPKKQKRAPKRKAATRRSPSFGDSEDDYDYDDPFIDDSGSEYSVSSDGSDTEWEDSQNVEEDSQETKRLLKEAKRFTKK